MPCGKKPLRKSWDKHRNLRVITPSRYEQNEASVKAHWRKVTRDLELSYKDDQFWESQSETVRTLVGPAIFQRIAKIFSLPTDAKQYEPQEDLTSPVPSELHTPYRRLAKNPHFEMLYCNESETDMIKWKSKYKISKEFYDWWVGLGNVEFKSEIKRPEDIEDLFQVWFNEHASRGLVLHPKIIPCVLRSIADFVGVPKAACPNALKRQIAYDIQAETSPAHYTAFGTSLPHKMKHFPPLNNTEQMWHCRPHLPMPKCLKTLGDTGDKKQLFVVPSDYVLRDRSITSSAPDLALP
ncbi:Uncharacterized protein OBRU01_19488, partial [Operophtera brumata]